MGWSGNFTHWSRRDTNKDIFLRCYPSIKAKVEDGEYKITQKGSNIYLLGKTEDGKYCVDCILCHREDGQEFMTKGIGALENHCFDFPKSWLSYLDPNDELVKEYLKARAEHEARQKAKTVFTFGDIIECIPNYDIEWGSSYKANKGEPLYLKVEKLNPYAKRATKMYVVAIKRKDFDGVETWCTTNRKIRTSTFKYGVSDIKLVERG